jgi:integrase
MADLARAELPELVAGAGVDQRPYLACLARYRTPRGRETARYALLSFARMLGYPDPSAVPWYRLRREHTSILWSRTVETCAPATANFRRALLRAILDECWLARLASLEDVTRAARLPRAKGTRLLRGRHLPIAEMRELVERCHARDQALLCLLYGGGFRRSELARADVEDLDEPAGTLRVVGKNDKERIVDLPPGTRHALAAWLAIRGRDPGPLLCQVPRSGVPRELARCEPLRRLSVGGITTQVRRLAKRIGLPPTSPHDFRRTYIGELFDLNVDVSTIQGLAGHANIATTVGYDRRPAKARAAAAARLYVPTRRG